eukprot:TRINITY_DN6979_c0_g1_i3.p1 TRINITY_DN6979_c0_g1~~TRINITY_DN6979_c0_g1_i3.p1  ORF type:complete len:354 (+),score=37.98 TRINITY_DN6979_c0_g1_i3:104-1063(+)
MQVGGDTLSCLNSAIQRNFGDRPMALDLLHSVLERGKEISSAHWGLLRVAVVELKTNVFHGRLFFGDTRTGKAVWDCDCRPSDGSWLAIKYNVPIYVHQEVWKECARELSLNQSPEKKLDGSGLEDNIDPNDPFQVRSNDFEVIKLLKREMKVALGEENYSEAARIRDHPFLLIYMRMLESQQAGRIENANKLRKQLEEMINESEKRRVEDRRAHVFQRKQHTWILVESLVVKIRVLSDLPLYVSRFHQSFLQVVFVICLRFQFFQLIGCPTYPCKSTKMDASRPGFGTGKKRNNTHHQHVPNTVKKFKPKICCQTLSW